MLWRHHIICSFETPPGQHYGDNHTTESWQASPGSTHYFLKNIWNNKELWQLGFRRHLIPGHPIHVPCRYCYWSLASMCNVPLVLYHRQGSPMYSPPSLRSRPTCRRTTELGHRLGWESQDQRGLAMTTDSPLKQTCCIGSLTVAMDTDIWWYTCSWRPFPPSDYLCVRVYRPTCLSFLTLKTNCNTEWV